MFSNMDIVDYLNKIYFNIVGESLCQIEMG